MQFTNNKNNEQYDVKRQ